MFARNLLIAVVFTLLPAAGAHAGFTITIENKTVAQGGSVTLDVTISGSDRLDLFAAEFVITPVGGAPAGGVRFAAVPAVPPLFDANYVFAPDNSFAIANLPSNPASVYQTTTTNDSYLASDGTLDFLGVDVSGGRLLARLTVTAGAIPVGAHYQVTYGANSLYLDETGAEVSVTLLGGDIEVVAGDATPVPAPPGMVLMLSGVLPCLGCVAARSRGRRA